MSYHDAISYLYSLQKHGIKLGLKKVENILLQLGNPHKGFRSIHVAGTNGKGSVSAMIASILTAHGFGVGLFTSPHLVSFTERIQINNEQITETDIISLTEEIKESIQELELNPTFFEFVTAMAFLYFSRKGIDYAVVETGMGGRLDATNVIMPDVSVITKISYDHREFLGETLTDIAREKAGIIKKGIPVVCAEQEAEAENVIRRVSTEKSSELFIYEKDFAGILKSSDIDGNKFDFHDSAYNITDLYIHLAGEHQLVNACLAIKASEIALKNRNALSVHSSPITHYCIREGLAAAELPGRLELANNNPLIMIDGAHNPDAANALSVFVKKHFSNHKIILVLGVMSDKDISGILKPLLPLASEIIFTAPDYDRAASPQKLAEIALHMGFSSRVANSVRDAVEMAKAEFGVKSIELGEGSSELQTQNSKFILITGSFYNAGKAKEILGETSVLGSLREKL